MKKSMVKTAHGVHLKKHQGRKALVAAGIAALTFGAFLTSGSLPTANAASTNSKSNTITPKKDSPYADTGTKATQESYDNGNRIKTTYTDSKGNPIDYEVTTINGKNSSSQIYGKDTKFDKNGNPTGDAKPVESILYNDNGTAAIQQPLEDGGTLTTYYGSAVDASLGNHAVNQEVTKVDETGTTVTSKVYDANISLNEKGEPTDSSSKPGEVIKSTRNSDGTYTQTTTLDNGNYTLVTKFKSDNSTPTYAIETIKNADGSVTTNEYKDGNVDGKPTKSSTTPAPNSGSSSSNSSATTSSTTTASSSSSTTSSSSSATPSSSSSSATSSSTMDNNSSTETVNSNLKNYYISLKSSHLFAKKGLYEYKGTHFNKSRRFKYVPAGTVLKATKVQSTANGKSEIKLSDGKYITGSKTFTTTAKFKKGYQTTPTKYAYVKSAKGINEYNKAAFGKAKKTSHAKKGVFLKVRRLVKSGSTTRYQLTNGHYITGAKSAVVGTNKR